jgi:general secretion pathway protein J
MSRRARKDQGFTLLELLVAMAIFGIISLLAMGGLNSVLAQQALARKQLDRLHQVQRAMRILTSDFSQVVPRAVRDEAGSRQLGFSARNEVKDCPFEYLVCFSREGWRNPFNQFRRGALQRVQYKLDDGKLIREHYTVMDRTLANLPKEDVLLDGVDRFELAFLDVKSEGGWQTAWPPLQQGAEASGFLQAVRIDFVLKDWGEIVRYVEVVPFQETPEDAQ